MNSGGGPKVTFDPEKVIQPFYTGGAAVLNDTGRILATSLGEDVIFTDLETGDQLASISGDGEAVTSLAITPSASNIAVCSRSNSMRIYALKPSLSNADRIEAELLRTLKPHSTPVLCSAVDGTGTLIATGGADGTVKVWDIEAGYATHTFKGHSGVISALNFFEQNESGTARNGGRKKNKGKGSTIGQDQQIQTPSSRLFRLASGGEDGHVRIWDLHSRKKIAALDSHSSAVRALDYSATKEVVVSTGRDKTLIAWDATTWKLKRIVPVLEGVESCSFIDSDLVYTGGESGRIRIWNIDRGQELTEEQPAGNDEQVIVDVIRCLALNVLISVHADNSFIFHSLEGLRDEAGIAPLQIVRRIFGTHDEIIDVAFLGRQHQLMALSTNSEDVRLISTSSDLNNAVNGSTYFGSDVGLLSGHSDIVICLDTDWSGCWIATGAKDNEIRLWKIDTEQPSYTCYAKFVGHTESIGTVSLPKTSPPKDSATFNEPLSHPPPFLVSGSQDRTIKKWEISAKSPSAKAIYTRKAHDKDINAIAIHPSLPIFASASQDKLVKIWSSESGEILGTLQGHRRGVWTASFAPSSISPLPDQNNAPSSKARGYILTGGTDKTLKIWSLADFTCMRTFEGHSNSILKALWFTPAPSSSQSTQPQPLLASAAADGLVKLWDPTTGDCISTLDNHTDRVWALTTISSTDPTNPSTTLVSGGADAVLTFWKDTTAKTAAKAAEIQSSRIEADQALQNHMRARDWRAAITLALELDHPGRLLTVLEEALATSTSTPPSKALTPYTNGYTLPTPSNALSTLLPTLSPSHVRTLLLRCRDWNTNARHAPIAQRVVGAVLRTIDAEKLARIRGVPEIIDGLLAYSERHYKRACEMVEASFVVDLMLERMGGVGGDVDMGLGDEETGAGAGAGEIAVEDVVMLD